MKNKTNLIQLSPEDITAHSLKKNIFEGKILLIKNSKEILKIIELTEQYFNYLFNTRITNSEKLKINYNKENSIFFEIIQKRIKFCKLKENSLQIFFYKLNWVFRVLLWITLHLDIVQQVV